MVQISQHRHGFAIICRPNKSLSWQHAKGFLLIVTLWCTGIATGCLIIGAWPVVPFMGLEIVALGIALYYVQWKLSHQEVLSVNEATVSFQCGQQWPKLHYEWPRDQLRILIQEASNHQLPSIKLTTANHRKTQRLGQQLNGDDLTVLIQLLRASSLRVRVYQASEREL